MSTRPAGKASISATRASRADGAATRQHLLDTAGRVFAQRGLAGATSKEICERAGTPLASVNYHFGSREGLYEAVLIEAHRQLVGLDELVALAAAEKGARAGLRAIVGHLAGLATHPESPWGFRVMLREVLAPSSALPALVEKAIRPKAAFVLGLVGELLGLSPAHPAVQRGVLFTVLPCIAMMLAPREVPGRLVPAASRDAAALVADFVDYTMAGLDALAQAHGASRPAPRAPARKAPARPRATTARSTGPRAGKRAGKPAGK